jgi:hypothetical protein
MDTLNRRLVLLDFSDLKRTAFPPSDPKYETLSTNPNRFRSFCCSELGPRSCWNFGVDKSRRQAKAGNEYYRNAISPQKLCFQKSASWQQDKAYWSVLCSNCVPFLTINSSHLPIRRTCARKCRGLPWKTRNPWSSRASLSTTDGYIWLWAFGIEHHLDFPRGRRRLYNTPP